MAIHHNLVRMTNYVAPPEYTAINDEENWQSYETAKCQPSCRISAGDSQSGEDIDLSGPGYLRAVLSRIIPPGTLSTQKRFKNVFKTFFKDLFKIFKPF